MSTNHVRITKKLTVTTVVVGVLITLIAGVFNGTPRLSAQEIPDHLKLKAERENIVGSKIFPNGDVKYAYKSNTRLALSPSLEMRQLAGQQGLLIQEEIDEFRTKHSRTFTTNDPTKLVTEVIAGEPQYYQDAAGDWWHTEYATTTQEVFAAESTSPTSLFSQIISYVYADTTTFYPEPGTGVSTVDGYVVAGGHSSWDSAHDATGGGEGFPSGPVMAIDSAHGEGGYSIRRAAFLFDTSPIPSYHTINSATVSLYATSKTNDDNDKDDFIAIVTSNLESNTNIVATDFDNIGNAINNPTEQHHASERKDITGIVTGQYVNWNLNATGIGNINKDGITKFGAREGHDIIDSSIPTEAASHLSVSSADEAGTLQDPKLTVIHTYSSNSPLLEIRKSANENRSLSATLNMDDILRLGLGANKTYSVEGVIFASSSSATPGVRIGWNFPADMTVDLGFSSGSGTSSQLAQLLTNSTPTSQAIPLSPNEPAVIRISGTVVVGSNHSTLSFLWAQGTADVTPTTILRGSYLRAEEI